MRIEVASPVVSAMRCVWCTEMRVLDFIPDGFHGRGVPARGATAGWLRGAGACRLLQVESPVDPPDLAAVAQGKVGVMPDVAKADPGVVRQARHIVGADMRDDVADAPLA